LKKNYSKSIERSNNVNTIHVSVGADHTLFRFREVNEFSLSAFRNNELWATTPDSFNDPYDTSFVINYKEVEKYLFAVLGEENLLKYRDELNIKTKSIHKIADVFIKNLYFLNQKNFRRLIIISCFSEDIGNEVMWSHYANQGRGFALEYGYNDLQNICKSQSRNTLDLVKDMAEVFPFLKDMFEPSKTDEILDQYGVKPVIYETSKYNATKLLIYAIDNIKFYLENNLTNPMDVFNKIFAQNPPLTPDQVRSMNDSIAFIKNANWSYEKEWRLVCPFPSYDWIKINDNHFCLGKIKPISIYFGEFMSDFNKATLMLIAKNCGLKINQMVSDHKRMTRQLSYKSVSNQEIELFLSKL